MKKMIAILAIAMISQGALAGNDFLTEGFEPSEILADAPPTDNIDDRTKCAAIRNWLSTHGALAMNLKDGQEQTKCWSNDDCTMRNIGGFCARPVTKTTAQAYLELRESPQGSHYQKKYGEEYRCFRFEPVGLCAPVNDVQCIDNKCVGNWSSPAATGGTPAQQIFAPEDQVFATPAVEPN